MRHLLILVGRGRETIHLAITLRKMHIPRRERAIIYIPPGVDVERWQKACLKHCSRRDYDLVAIVIDPDGAKWTDVIAMTAAGEVDVTVVFDITALPEDRSPRVEEVGVEQTGDLPKQRRPRLFRRR